MCSSVQPTRSKAEFQNLLLLEAEVRQSPPAAASTKVEGAHDNLRTHGQTLITFAQSMDNARHIVADEPLVTDTCVLVSVKNMHARVVAPSIGNPYRNLAQCGCNSAARFD